jgi:hypothetical protein
MPRPILPLAVFAVLTLTGCQQSAQSTTKPSRAPAARVVGEAIGCIPITQIRTSRVHDDFTIDFEMAGGKLYRNTLPGSCPGLGFEESFTYETSLSQLCSVDIIYPLQRTGATLQRGVGCGLGKFVPIALDRK